MTGGVVVVYNQKERIENENLLLMQVYQNKEERGMAREYTLESGEDGKIEKKRKEKGRGS
jgi:hypothetical protein